MKTEYKKLLAAVTLIVVTAIVILAVSNNEREEYFKQVELPVSNTIINSLDNIHYYDTILAIGMDKAGVTGTTVVVNSMSDAAKRQFEGELKAHIRLFNGVYYLFIGAYTRQEAIEVISHEIVHIQQYESRELIYENEEVIWHNQVYSLEGDYENRPWERDAFSKQGQIQALILSTLY